MGWVRCPRGLSVLSVPATNTNSGLADFLLGLSEAAGLIKDSEIAVQIVMSVGVRVSLGDKKMLGSLHTGAIRS